MSAIGANLGRMGADVRQAPKKKRVALKGVPGTLTSETKCKANTSDPNTTATSDRVYREPLWPNRQGDRA